MSGGARISSATMSCLCPPDCCSPEVEKEENYIWFLIKVFIRNLFILSHHLLIIVPIFINFLHTTILLASFVKFYLKVLYGQWIVMGSLAVPIIARQPKNHLISKYES